MYVSMKSVVKAVITLILVGLVKFADGDAAHLVESEPVTQTVAAAAGASVTTSSVSVNGGAQMLVPESSIVIGRRIRERNPLAAVEWYESALGNLSTSNVAVRLELLDDLSEVLSLVKRPREAVKLRHEALTLRLKQNEGKMSVSELVSTYASMAQDLQNEGKYEAALKLLRKAGGVSELDPSSKSVLLKFESSIHDCSGDAVQALQSFEQSMDLRQKAGSSLDPSDALLHLDLIARVRASSESKPPPSMDRALAARRDSILHGVLARGPWTNPLQLPKEFIPGLASRPWHSIEEHYPHLSPVRELLMEAHASLVREYRQLQAKKLMLPETECIHDSKSGAWKWYATNGFWVPRDADGCSLDTPAACALLARVANLTIPGLHVLRSGYSAVSKSAHLRPHCGMTNGQLKFHLGLVVPKDTKGHPCARIRVGNESRAWEAGKVLFFDDSWEHEVWNECDKERVVFQFVFVHPDLAALKRLGSNSQQSAQRKLPDAIGH